MHGKFIRCTFTYYLIRTTMETPIYRTTFKTKLALRRYLDSILGCPVHYYMEQPDTIFCMCGHEIARWDYDNEKAIILDYKYFEI